MDKKEKCIKSNLIYDGKILSLYKDEIITPNNITTYREIVRHKGGVCCLSIKDGYIYFVKQYRYAYSKEILELPAGKLEDNENPIDAMKRELKEEIGFISKSLEYMGYMYPSVGYTDEIIHLFYSSENEVTSTARDIDEFMDIIKIKIEDSYRMLDNNEFEDAKTIILLSKLRKVLLKD
ncbi:NUDIX hydrolase [bacterium]|nr:NUDIX hydrolase [bacterium]